VNELRLISQEVFIPSPAPGAGIIGGSYYTRASGDELQSIHFVETRSDTADSAHYRRSTDNGATWTHERSDVLGEPRPEGMWRCHPRGGYVDVATDRFLSLRNEGVLPTDAPLEGMQQWVIHYTVSVDGGRTVAVDEPVVHVGADAAGVAYDADHALPEVWRGRAGVMLGDLTCTPMTMRGGDAPGQILVPCQICPVGPDGHYLNKGAGFTFHDSAVLHGTWQPDLRLEWRLSERVIGDPERSTRGFLEPTIAELSPGRVLMVMRGSNDARPELPGHRWYTISEDGAQTFGDPQPWSFTDGVAFHSPSACSQLLEHSSGRLFWLGNLCADNPRGNGPRYPIVIVEVERDTGLLRRETLLAIDDRQSDEQARLTLSNFYAREDRRTGEVCLHLPRYFAQLDTFEADNVVYRIALD
jgi:hypothetical protein